MTSLLVALSITVTAVIVIVLVIYLIAIIAALWSAKNSLSKLAVDLIAIRDNTQPLPEHMQTINNGLSTLLQELLAVNNNLDAVVTVAQGKEQKG